MVKPNKPKVIRTLEQTISRIVLDGLVWEKKVSKGSNCGLICVPEALVGKRLKVILIPVDQNESLSTQKEIAINNDNMRRHNAVMTRLANKNKKLEEKQVEEEKESTHVPAIPNEPGLEDEDAY